jgi:hypothetical protein
VGSFDARRSCELIGDSEEARDADEEVRMEQRTLMNPHLIFEGKVRPVMSLLAPPRALVDRSCRVLPACL